MTVHDWIQLLHARRSGKSWKAKCPAHNDRRASLSISEGREGRTLLKCFGRCELDAILSAVGKTKRDLFPDDMFASANARPRRDSAAKQSPAFDWQKRVAAFTEKDVERIAKWRGYSPEFVRELRDNGQIGIHNHYGNRLVAFPVHNGGQIVGCHFRLKDGTWQYFPKGIAAEPWVIGELQPDRNHIFESTWDGLAYMDKSGERDGIVITRGAGNAKRAAALISRDSTAFLWTQNDEPDTKTGVKPAETWQQDFVEASTCKIRRVKFLAHDLNDWTRNGATTENLMARLISAEAIREQSLETAPDDASFARETAPVTLDDFRAYMPQHSYIFVPSRDLWPASSVNARIPPVPLMRNGEPVLDEDGEQKFISASAWLDRNRPVEQMTWAPAEAMIVQHRLISEGGWIERRGCSIFNLYRPPNIKPGDARKAGLWLDHAAMLYPHDKDHIVRWLAQRVQRPDVKINHALFLGGNQGIGKDTLLYPVKHAVGMWNVTEILPPALLGRFNGFAKSVLLCVNEVHDLGDLNRYGLYERLKAYTAAPPDVIRVDEKNIREHSVLNVCGVIITTNYKTGGLYLPADDRRHYVAWSDLEKESVPAHYWPDIYSWYARGGIRHVAAYLVELDISGFNPKAPPPKTDAFWEIVESNRAPENAELADALENIDNPDAVTIKMVIDALPDTEEFRYWLKDRKNSRQIPHRFEECGYVAVRNPYESEGRWKIGKNSYAVYAKKTLSRRDQIIAVEKCIEEIKPFYPQP